MPTLLTGKTLRCPWRHRSTQCGGSSHRPPLGPVTDLKINEIHFLNRIPLRSVATGIKQQWDENSFERRKFFWRPFKQNIYISTKPQYVRTLLTYSFGSNVVFCPPPPQSHHHRAVEKKKSRHLSCYEVHESCRPTPPLPPPCAVRSSLPCSQYSASPRTPPINNRHRRTPAGGGKKKKEKQPSRKGRPFRPPNIPKWWGQSKHASASRT